MHSQSRNCHDGRKHKDRLILTIMYQRFLYLRPDCYYSSGTSTVPITGNTGSTIAATRSVPYTTNTGLCPYLPSDFTGTIAEVETTPDTAITAYSLFPSVLSDFTGAIAGNRHYSTGAIEEPGEHEKIPHTTDNFL